MGPGQGGSRSEMGLGGRKYSREEIGPRPGRVPGLFLQNREVSFISSLIIMLIQFLIYIYSNLPRLNFGQFSVCVSVYLLEGRKSLGRNMGPGQGGSQVGDGLGGRKYLGRTLGPGQGGSQDYFAKKGD